MTALTRREIPALRRTMKALGVVTAETDTELRYVWIENPHPDFDPESVVGKRDAELIPEGEAAGIVALKQLILAPGRVLGGF
jgi:hypothetical protein